MRRPMWRFSCCAVDPRSRARRSTTPGRGRGWSAAALANRLDRVAVHRRFWGASRRSPTMTGGRGRGRDCAGARGVHAHTSWLAGFDMLGRLLMHLNTGWRPLVPPRSLARRGVFATRAASTEPDRSRRSRSSRSTRRGRVAVAGSTCSTGRRCSTSSHTSAPTTRFRRPPRVGSTGCPGSPMGRIGCLLAAAEAHTVSV